MSEFVAKIVADLETSSAEKKLEQLTEDRKVKIKTDVEVDKKSTQEAIKQTQKQTEKNPVKVNLDYKESMTGISKLSDSANRLFSLFSGNRNLLDLNTQKIREAITDLKELNTTLVEIDKSGNLSQTQLSKLANDSYDAASKWGALVQAYMSSAETFSQAGYSNLEEMADLSTMAQTAGQMTEQTATNFLIASDNAWQMKGNVEKLTSVLDGMNSVTNHNALNMTELANGIRVAGSMLSNSGLAEDQATALLGTGIATTKDSGETVARGLRTIIMNLRQVKGETDDGEIIDTEQLEKVEKTCAEVGVSLKTVKDGVMELRNPIDVLRELSEVYNSLDTMDARRANIISDVAGKHRSNILASILTNFDQYDKMLQDYANGEGSAFNEAMKSADSWEGKLQSLQNTWLEFVNNFVQADTMKGGITFFDNMISAMDSLQDKQLFLPTLTSAIMGLRSVFSGKGITDISLNKDGKGLDKLNIEGSLLGINFSSINKWKEHFVDVENYLGKWNSLCLKGKASLKDFGGEFVKQNKDFKDYISIVKDGSASLGGYKAHLQSAGVEFENFNMKSFITNAATGFLATSAIELALAGITTVIDDVIQKQDRLAEAASEATSSWEESNNALSEQVSKYKELKQQLDSGTLTPTEEYDTRQQILDIQMQITDQYGEQASNLDLVNGNLQTQLGLLQEISAENAKQMLNENREEYKNAENQMTRERAYNLGSIEISDESKLSDEIKDVVNSFEESGLSLTENGGGGKYFNILFKGDATQAEETINDFMNKIEELKSKFTNEDSIDLLDSILDQAGKSYSENKDEIIGKNESSYKKFLQADMVSKGTEKGSVADTFDKYTEAVEKYNEALSSGDMDTINKARSDFAAISDEVDNLLSKSENSKFSILFDDITDQLNTASIKSMEFQEALAGNSNSKNQFHDLSDGIKQASDGLDKLELDAVDAMNALVTSGEQAGENELWTLAEAWGITAESSKEDIQGFIDVLVQAGLISGETENSVESASKSFESFSASVEKTISNFETLKSVMSESVSGAGISADNLSSFRGMFGDDAEKALEKTANGYHLNKKALAELQEQMGERTKTDYLSALSEQYTQLQDIEAQIATAEVLGMDTSGLEASRNGILDNITSLQDLQIQYETATSAYQQWQAALSGGEEGDMYDSIYGNIEKAKELYDQGLTGTNAFREFADLMSNQDLTTASNEEIVAAYEKALPAIQRYFTDGQEGAQNFLTDIQNINSEWAHMNEDGTWDINFGENDQEIADALDIDVEAVQSILRKLSDYGFDINLDRPVASMKELKAQAESANQTLGDLGDDLNIDIDANSFEDIDTQISTLKEYMDGIEDTDLDLDVKTDKLESANSILEYLVRRKQEIGQNESVDVTVNVDENALQAGYETLNRLRSALNIEGQIGIDKTGVQQEIGECISQIEAMSPEMKVALGIQGMSIEEIKSGLMDGSVQIPVNADTAKANSNINEVKNNKVADKNFSVTANTSQATMALSTVKSYLSDITSKEVTVTVNKVTKESKESSNKSSDSGGHSINGTAHAQGTAFATGSWGNPTAGKKLVGELGTELVVNPHSGRWYTVGDNGAEFVNIPKNAIVFNHLQTESLLNKGHIMGRGKALSSGTALASGTALSDGTGKFGVGNSGSSSTSNNSSNNNTGKNKGKSKSNNKKDSKQTIDWIARKLERLQQIIDLTKAKFENLFTVKKKDSNLSTQITQTTNLLKANEKAAKAYQKYAGKVKLSSSLKKKVQSGNYTITDYSESTAKQINKYKDYYDKYKEAQKQVHELTTQIRELNEQKYQLYVDQAESQIERYSAAISVGTDYKKNNKYVDSQIAQTKESYKYQIKIAKLTNDTIKVKQLEAEKEKAVIELQKQKFDHIQTYYENQVALLQASENAIQNQVDLLDAKGMTVNAKYYTDQIGYENQKYAQLKKSKSELETQLKSIKKGTEEWYECKSAIADVSSELTDCNKTIAEMNSSITELADDFHEKMMEAGNTIMETMDWAVSLMDNVDFFDSETGDMTKEGLATLGSYVSGYNTSGAMSDMYRRLAANLESNYNKGILSFTDSNGKQRTYNSLEEFKASIDETYAAWRDQISTTYDYQSKIVEMMRNKLDNELSALKELIEAKEDALQREKDLRGYQQSIQDKTKNIDIIKKQIAGYSGDTSQEAKAKSQQLQVQLSESEKDLRETEYDKYISDQEDMLDRLYEEYEKSITAELQNVQKLLQDGIDIAKSTSNSISEVIRQYTDFYDYRGRFDSLVAGISNITDSSDSSIIDGMKKMANEGVQSASTASSSSSSASSSLKTAADKVASAIASKITVPKIDSTVSTTKASTTKKSATKSKTTQGDGKIQVGDKATFKSGRYYASSAGTGASGNQKLGKNVYVAKINPGSKYPYLISTSKSVNNGLGWVKKSQLSGFKTGGIARFIKSKGEDGITMVRNGEGLIPPENVEPIQDLIKAAPKIDSSVQTLTETASSSMPKMIAVPKNPPRGDLYLNVELPHVLDPNEFVRTLQTSPKVQKALRTYTTDQLSEKDRIGEIQ